ncbi:MAG: hypothetical protein KUG82_05130 [Pseudomonadales bacterium]|nr:hypothetical protein [Pseudomonadales bacterium]
MALFKRIFSKVFSEAPVAIKTDILGVPESTIEQFAENLIREISTIYPSADTRYLIDKKALQINYNAHDSRMPISAIFSDLKLLDGHKREACIRDWIKSSFEEFDVDLENEFNTVASHLLLGIRTRAGLESRQLQQKLEGKSEDEETLGEISVLGGNLVLEFLVDDNGFSRISNASDFKLWGVELEEVRSFAIANLWKKSDAPYLQIAEGVWQSPWQDGYDSSRILLVDKLRELEVIGETVVFIPSRDHLLVVGSEDVEALERVVVTSEMVLSQTAHPLTGQPYVIRDAGVEVFCPPPEHPAYGLAKRAEYYSIALEYKFQKQLLEKIFNSENIDIFVASYTVKERGEDDVSELADSDKDDNSNKGATANLSDVRYSSYCVWSEGITSWLPESEEIVFCQAGQDGQFNAIATATWKDCKAHLEKYFHKIESYPARWEVKEFPSSEELSSVSLLNT